MAVASAIAAGCTTGMRSWSPLPRPEGVAAEVGALNAKAKGKQLVVRYTPTVAEDVTVSAGFVPAARRRRRFRPLLADAGRSTQTAARPGPANAIVSARPRVLAVVLAAALDP